MRQVGQHLTSVFGDSLKTTFNISRKDNPGYATAAVDMMFVSSDIEVIEKACPAVDVSDHLPLVVQLRL
jgi:endonuclease/exonuclease/phosphatase family metal-dependent hydrolase